MKVDVKRPGHLLLLLLQLIYTWLAIVLRPLVRQSPRHVVLLYGHQFSGNLRALYREWERTRQGDFDLYFLTLDPEQGRRLSEQGVHTLCCNRLRDMMVLARASAIISDHGLHMMSPLLRFTDIHFVDVWHGIPFKGFVPSDFKLQHRYREVWVSSPMLKQLYVEKFGFTPDRVRDLGYARADPLFLGAAPDADFRRRASIPDGSRIVLYAPTWQQDDRGRELFPFGVSQDGFIEALSEVCQSQGATLVIRSHLNAQISSQSLENVRYCSMRDFPDTEGILQHTDVLICDWSSIAFDYLALNRPAIFLDVEPPFRNGFSLGREFRYGQVVTDVDSMNDAVRQTLASRDSYDAVYGDKHAAITNSVYGNNADGMAASRQLARLEEITGA